MGVYREQHWGWLWQLAYDSLSDCDLHKKFSLAYGQCVDTMLLRCVAPAFRGQPPS